MYENNDEFIENSAFSSKVGPFLGLFFQKRPTLAFLQKVGLVWQLRHHLKRISNSKRTLYWSKDRVSGINQNNSSVVKKIVVASFFLKPHSKKKSAFMRKRTTVFCCAPNLLVLPCASVLSYRAQLLSAGLHILCHLRQ